MKVCKDCGTQKPLTEYYKHSGMLDGYLNKCIECVKARVKKHRSINIETIKEFDKKRGMLPHRVQARKAYLQTEQGKAAKKRAHDTYKEKYPMKHAAHILFRNAVRDKMVEVKDSCEECNSKLNLQGHHDDYTKPLEVRWLCVKCHNLWHKTNKPIYK